MSLLRLLTIVLCLFLFLQCSQNDEKGIFLNEPEGFRNYKWGTKFDDFEDLEIQESRAKNRNYPTIQLKRKSKI
jgi:hypothetical protein